VKYQRFAFQLNASEDAMKEHKYFTVGNASHLANPDDGLCIFAGDAPKRLDDGKTAHSLRAPFVLISSIISDRPDMAEVLAEVLNENAARFFSSARIEHQTEEASADERSPTAEPSA
jgi:hypothetical protein